jgi:DNA-binding HxlR family transcriptional regulator
VVELEALELKILVFLLLHGPARKTDLARALGARWQTLSLRLERLIEKKLVARTLVFQGRPPCTKRSS